MSYNAYFYRTKSSVMDTADGYPFEALSGESLIFLTALTMALDAGLRS